MVCAYIVCSYRLSQVSLCKGADWVLHQYNGDVPLLLACRQLRLSLSIVEQSQQRHWL